MQAPQSLQRAEFQQDSDELTELLMRWNRHGQQASADEDHQTYLVYVFIQPRP